MILRSALPHLQFLFDRVRQKRTSALAFQDLTASCVNGSYVPHRHHAIAVS